MFERSPRYASIVLTLLLPAAIACNRTSAAPTTPAPAGGALKASFTAEPLVVRPQFLAGFSCPTRPAFGVRITIVLGSGEDVILRGFRFSFSDRFGGRAIPAVFFTSDGSSIPTSTPVPFPGVAPLPTRGPIPIPGSPPIDGVLVSELTSRKLPFFLRFGCGVFPDGTILIDGDFNDRHGRPDRAEMRVRVTQ